MPSKLKTMKTTQNIVNVKAIADGDEQAFSVLFLCYFPKVKRFITGLLQDASEAEDISQDIFVKLWQVRSELPGVENINAYLYQAARNAAFQNMRRTVLFNDYSTQQQRAALYSSDLKEFNIEDELYADELELLVCATIEKMPPQRKKIYQMSRLEGKGNEDIATFLDISKRTVENHLTQALADIRRAIKNVYLFI